MPPSPARPSEGLSRRALLCGACALAACAKSPPTDTGARCAGAPDASWLRIPLSEHPALAEPGAGEAIALPEEQLYAMVVHQEDGCYAATWSICTHGACELEWSAEDAELVCPCHGSRFGLDGAVLEGPATRALRTFAVVREGDTLLLDRS